MFLGFMTLRPNAVWTHSRRTGRPARTLGGPRAALLQRRRPRSSLTPRRCFPQRGSPLRPLPLLRQARSRERKRSPGARNGPRRAPRFGRRRPGLGASPHRGPPARRGRSLREADKSDETEPPRLTRRAAPQPLRHDPQLPVQPAEDLVQPLQVLRGRGAADRHSERPPPADSGLRAASRPRFRHRPRGPAPAQRGVPTPDGGLLRAAPRQPQRREGLAARCPPGAVVAGPHAVSGRPRLWVLRPAPGPPHARPPPIFPGGWARLFRARSVRTRRGWSWRRRCRAAGARCWALPCPCPS